jgi:spore coat protein U-like protein
VLTKSNCKFSTTTGTLPFGNIDTGGSTDATATASLSFRCNGSAPIATYLISDDDGLNANQMAHTTLAGTFLPYELSYTPTTGSVPRGDTLTLAITGTVNKDDYRVAVAGAYSDTVILSILP